MSNRLFRQESFIFTTVDNDAIWCRSDYSQQGRDGDGGTNVSDSSESDFFLGYNYEEHAGWAVYFPTHRGETAMDGAPERLWLVGRRPLQRQKQVSRCTEG